MTATVLALPGRDDVRVTGVGYDPVGDFYEGQRQLNPVNDDVLARILKAAALNTDAFLERQDDEGPWGVVGDTTEGALLVAARKAGWSRATLEEDMPRVAELPFSSERKAMTTIHQPKGKFAAQLFENARFISFTKGAPDQLLAWATHETMPDGPRPLDMSRIEAWRKQIDKMADEGLRVLALGYRPLDALPEDDEMTPQMLERDLTLLGLIGIVDPPRSEAKRAIKVAAEAGIRSVMITGDHKLTAQAIARQLGLMQPDGRALTGVELDRMSEKELRDAVQEVSVYARVTPEHKLRIVEALQSHGQIVAMTGDGVNDAPALKQANIGVAMGISRHRRQPGRGGYGPHRRQLRDHRRSGRRRPHDLRQHPQIYSLPAEHQCRRDHRDVPGAAYGPARAVARDPNPLDQPRDRRSAGSCAGVRAKRADVMKRKPRPPRESIFAHGVGLHVIWVGIWLGIVTLLGFIWTLNRYAGGISNPSEEGLLVARTVAFTILALSQVAEVSAIHGGMPRSLRRR